MIAGGRRRAALFLCLALVACREGSEQATPTPEMEERAAERVAVTLHFPSEDGMLQVERREMALPADPAARLEAIVGALLSGPQQQGLLAPFPPGVESAEILLDPQGVVYVDLLAGELPDPPPSGSALEIVRVYSVVNTVLANEDDARAVVLLWNGRQRQTFAGHLDTARPLVANRRLVR
jgi:hypothetical protein